MTSYAYVPDLMDRSKVSAAVPDAVIVARPADLGAAGPGDLVFVDLGRPGVLDVLPGVVDRGARVVGFCNHEDDATIGAATAAGVEALTRAVFFRRLA